MNINSFIQNVENFFKVFIIIFITILCSQICLSPFLLSSAELKNNKVANIELGIVSPNDTFIETISVPANGEIKYTRPLLEGEVYTFISRGTVYLGYCLSSECSSITIPHHRNGDTNFITLDSWKTAELAMSSDSQGLWIDDSRPSWYAIGTSTLSSSLLGDSNSRDYETSSLFSSDNIYKTEITGVGRQIALRFADQDGVGTDNTGFLEVSIYKQENVSVQRGEWHGIPNINRSDLNHEIKLSDTHTKNNGSTKNSNNTDTNNSITIPLEYFSAAATVAMVGAKSGVLPILESKNSNLKSNENDFGKIANWNSYIAGYFHLLNQQFGWSYKLENNNLKDDSIISENGILSEFHENTPPSEDLPIVLKKLGLSVPVVISADSDIPFEIVSQTLQKAFEQEWLVIVQFSTGIDNRFAVVKNFWSTNQYLELGLFDPLQKKQLDSQMPFYYALQRDEVRASSKDIPFLSIKGLWTVSVKDSVSESNLKYIIDNNSPNFSLKASREDIVIQKQRGFGALYKQDNTDNSFALSANSDINLQYNTGSVMVRSKGTNRFNGEGIWKISVTATSKYNIWVYIPNKTQTKARRNDYPLVSNIRYYITKNDKKELTSSDRVASIAISSKNYGKWHRVANIAIKNEEPIFLRAPVRGEDGQYVIFDSVLIEQDQIEDSTESAKNIDEPSLLKNNPIKNENNDSKEYDRFHVIDLKRKKLTDSTEDRANDFNDTPLTGLAEDDSDSKKPDHDEISSNKKGNQSTSTKSKDNSVEKK